MHQLHQFRGTVVRNNIIEVYAGKVCGIKNIFFRIDVSGKQSLRSKIEKFPAGIFRSGIIKHMILMLIDKHNIAGTAGIYFRTDLEHAAGTGITASDFKAVMHMSTIRRGLKRRNCNRKILRQVDRIIEKLCFLHSFLLFFAKIYHLSIIILYHINKKIQ